MRSAAAGRAGLGFLDAGQAQASAEQMLGAQSCQRPAPFHILVRSVRGDRAARTASRPRCSATLVEAQGS